MTVLQSNYLASLAVDVRADMTAYRRSSIEAHRAYIRAGKRLLEARGEAKRGEWLPFLAACEVPVRTAQNLLKLARGGWHPKALTAIGGVRTALDFEALVSRLTAEAAGLPASVVEARKAPAAIAARKGAEAFMAFCEKFDLEPANVIRRLADEVKPGGKKSETISQFSGPDSAGMSAPIPDDLDERRATVRQEQAADRERIEGAVDATAARVKREIERERFQPATASAPAPDIPDPGESPSARMRRRRAERREEGRCADCGAVSGEAYRCPPCQGRRAEANERAAGRRRIGRALEGQIRTAAARGKGVRLTAADVRALVDGERKAFGARLAKVGEKR